MRRRGALIQKLALWLVVLLACCSLATAQSWTPVTTQFQVGIALQLTDRTILIQQFDTPNWWILTPNNEASYPKGKLTPAASFPATEHYAPLYFASAVLKDGRAIVAGGEFNYGTKPTGSDTTKAAIYDPTVLPNGKWTVVPHPTGWTTIGDAQSVVLPTGTLMLANCCALPPQAALLNESTLKWTILTSTKGFKGKTDGNDEEGWTLLPDGKVLTVDTYWPASFYYNPNGENSAIYDPSTGTWTSAGNTVQQLWDSRSSCGDKTSNETGTAILRPDGTVFVTGANSCPGSAGHTAIYNSLTGVWTAGPDIPGGNDMADAPAALLPNGDVLIDTNPGYGNNPSTFYEFTGSGYLPSIPQPTGLNPSNTEGARLLVTAQGTVLLTHLGSNNIWFYNPPGTYKPEWQPHICPGCYPATAYIGDTYTVQGTQFNGLSQGAAFGDDGQSATNYPLVLIKNNATGHKHFARTHSFSTMAVATGNELVSCKFDVLPGTEGGDSTMVVIANGIPSEPVGIIVRQKP